MYNLTSFRLLEAILYWLSFCIHRFGDIFSSKRKWRWSAIHMPFYAVFTILWKCPLVASLACDCCTNYLQRPGRYFSSGQVLVQLFLHSSGVWTVLRTVLVSPVFTGEYIGAIRSRKPRLTTVGIRCADHVIPSIRKSWHYLRQQAAVARLV
jgi:hypothetical protein